jgi:NADH-quinone oxidoreductase subunit G
VARALGLADRDGSGMLEVPGQSNARGLREVGCLPNAGPGYREVTAGADAARIAERLDAGELTAAILVNSDPIRDNRDGARWRQALDHAEFVVACSMFGTIRRRAPTLCFRPRVTARRRAP